jgi:hypothetical protein
MRSPLVSYCDPEARALLAARAHARELEYLAGQIGEATFLRSLMNYGQSLAEARHALWSLKRTDKSL